MKVQGSWFGVQGSGARVTGLTPSACHVIASTSLERVTGLTPSACHVIASTSLERVTGLTPSAKPHGGRVVFATGSR